MIVCLRNEQFVLKRNIREVTKRDVTVIFDSVLPPACCNRIQSKDPGGGEGRSKSVGGRGHCHQQDIADEEETFCMLPSGCCKL